jgi:DNA modification methylase
MEADRCQILVGDCRTIMPSLEARSVQTCVTSPPYWGLRDFGTGQWEGGGCALESLHQLSSGVCVICGARRIDQQLGLESTPEEFIANMVAVFREVWRVLRDDGTLWLNLGDCYTGSHTTYSGKDAKWQHGEIFRQEVGRTLGGPGLKPKDLCLMPARVALALQADGWFLRSEIVWAKPNPMPESVLDRPTKSHEMIYLLAKQERYFFDAEAIREPAEFGRLITPNQKPSRDRKSPSTMHWGNVGDAKNPVVRNGDWSGQYRDPDSGRNKRSVWTIATQPYAEAHFATFPEEIPKLCILAGSRLGDTVLDPFAGSGTVGQVALELGRRAVLIELNPDYVQLAQERTFVTPGFL